MKHINKILLICMLTLAFPAQNVRGVDYWTPSLSGPLGFIEFSAYLIIVTPSAVVEESKPENRRRNRERKERKNAEQRKKEALRRKAQMNVPDMEVKEIIITLDEYEKEKWEIRLEDTANPENYAVLIRYFWPEQRENRSAFPEEKLQQGDRILFEATERGNGWFLRNDRGEKITYIPVEDVQLESFSEKF